MNAGWNEYKDIKETLKGLIEKGYTVSMIQQVLEENFIDYKAEQTAEDTAEWIEEGDTLDDYVVCSNCGNIESYPQNYCPNCGAKMKGDTE